MNLVVAVGMLISLATFVPVAMQLRAHPRGLVVLFLVEMWERFSYAGMRGLLIFYLTEHFLFADKAAQAQYGAYNALAYLTPLLGGVLADRVLGARRAVAFGALLLVAGHFLMGFEGRPASQTLTTDGREYVFQASGHGAARTVKLAVDGKAYAYSLEPDGRLALAGPPADASLPAVLQKRDYALNVRPVAPLFENTLYLALGLIAVGVGFVKPNVAALVGKLYPQGDPRIDAGFTLYYYGINLGSFWAAIACGWLGQNLGWSYGFGAAGVGMLAGYVVLLAGRKHLTDGTAPAPESAAKRWTAYALGLATVGAVAWLMPRHLTGYLLAACSAGVLSYLGVMIATRCTPVERQRMFLALILIAGAVTFATLFDQAGTSLNQFAQRNTDLRLPFGQALAPAQTQSFNPGFILLLAPVFAWMWASLARRGREPPAPVKSALGLAQVGLGFLLLAWGAQFAGADHRTPLIFLAGAYLLHTTAELCLWTLGLSQMSKLAPAALASTMMATWYLASAWAHWLGAQIAQLTATETVAGQVLDRAASLATYAEVFSNLGLFGVGAAAAMLALSPWIKGWRHGA